MNLSAVLIIFGAMLLLIPQTMWMGIALLAIGAVTYSVTRRSPTSLPQAWYSPYPQRLERAGISMTRRHPLEKGQQGPQIKDDMFNLPLPIDEEVARFMNVSYKTPTQAKGFTQEKEKAGHPWLPGM